LLSDFYARHAICKTCAIARSRIWALTNPESRRESARKWARNNIEYQKAVNKRCYERDPDYGKRKWAKYKERLQQDSERFQQRQHSQQKYREDNREQRLAYNKQYHKDHVAERSASRKRWREHNPDRVNELTRSWYAKNIEYHKARFKKRREEHPEEVRLQNQRRRAQQLNAQGITTAKQIQSRFDYYGGRCWMCRIEANTIDHVKPLTKGGSNFASNLRPACKSCNSSKRDKWFGVKQLHQFTKEQQQ
jgi:hypothetical protein